MARLGDSFDFVGVLYRVGVGSDLPRQESPAQIGKVGNYGVARVFFAESAIIFPIVSISWICVQTCMWLQATSSITSHVNRPPYRCLRFHIKAMSCRLDYHMNDQHNI